QIDYLLKKDIGFDKEAVMYTFTAFDHNDQRNQVLKEELQKQSFIKEVSLSSEIPIAHGLWTTTIKKVGDTTNFELGIQIKKADTSFIHLYNIPLVIGRNYREASNETLINEMAVSKLGYENPAAAIGEQVNYNRTELIIVGVVKNIHTQSMYNEIRPILIKPDTLGLYTTNVKLKPNID
ncbi:hypothetical protein C9994_17650, partial [Marivirga lumbricoides]